MLQRECEPAGPVEYTQSSRLTQPFPQSDIEDLHEDLSYVSPHPLIKDGDKKIPVLLSSYGSIRYFIPSLFPPLMITLHNRDELEEFRF